MDDLAKQKIDDFLDSVGDRTPTPGGGGVTALAGALACALARMVAAYSVNKSTAPDVRAQVEALATRLHRADQLFRSLITRDAEAYARMTEAAASPRRQPAEGAAGQAAYDDAVLAAAAVPLEAAAVASNALMTMDELKAVAGRAMLSDLAVAAVLAEATARASAHTVKVNARHVSDAESRARLLANIEQIVTHCVGHRESIEAFVVGQIEKPASADR